MYSLITLAALLPLGLAVPTNTKRSDECELTCEPYEGFFGGAYFSPSYRIYNTQTGHVNQIGLNMLSDGSYPLQLEPCGDKGCDVPGGGWKFEVCQNKDGNALNGQTNNDTVKYGHVVYTNSTLSHQLCLGSTATGTSQLNNTQLILHECEYNYDNAALSGQYWRLDVGAPSQTTTGSVTNGQALFHPNPTVLEYQPLTIWTPSGNDTEWISQFVFEPATQQD